MWTLDYTKYEIAWNVVHSEGQAAGIPYLQLAANSFQGCSELKREFHEILREFSCICFPVSKSCYRWDMFLSSFILRLARKSDHVSKTFFEIKALEVLATQKLELISWKKAATVLNIVMKRWLYSYDYCNKKVTALTNKKTKFSSYIRKFRWDRVQSHKWWMAP